MARVALPRARLAPVSRRCVLVRSLRRGRRAVERVRGGEASMKATRQSRAVARVRYALLALLGGGAFVACTLDVDPEPEPPFEVESPPEEPLAQCFAPLYQCPGT